MCIQMKPGKLFCSEILRGVLDQLPGVMENEEVSNLFNSPQFQDPALLKRGEADWDLYVLTDDVIAIVDGLRMARQYSVEIKSLLSDPSKIGELLDQLPPEMDTMKLFVQSILSGDKKGVTNLLASIPGLSRSQKKMFLDLFDGNVGSIQENVKQVLQDSDQIEMARQQFLANPEVPIKPPLIHFLTMFASCILYLPRWLNYWGSTP